MNYILTLTALLLTACAPAQVCPEPYGCSSGDPAKAAQKPTERPTPIKPEKPTKPEKPGKPHGDKPGHGHGDKNHGHSGPRGKGKAK